jgi:RNA polymerase-binding protein DksA
MANQQFERATEFAHRLRDRAQQLRGEMREVLDRTSEETHANIAQLARDNEDDSFSNLIVDLNHFDIDRDAAEIRRIDAALVRVSDGTFGICADCGQDIPMARLEAEPTAERCIGCQERFEKTHAGTSTPSL